MTVRSGMSVLTFTFVFPQVLVRTCVPGVVVLSVRFSL